MAHPITPKLHDILSTIYGAQVADDFAPRFAQLITRDPIPPRTYDFNERDALVIAYGDHVQSPDATPLATLHDFAKKHFSGAVNTVHILPHYPYTCDDGFGVSDYRSVNPELGTWDDLKKFSRDFSLMYDAVINHVSGSHEWFKKFLAGDEAYQHYFFALEENVDVSAVVRPRTHPLLTPFKTAHGTKYLWTTFSDDQIDLNYGNPEVLYEIVDLLLDYVRKGADLLRLDAIGFIWRNPAESSIHHPNAHALIKLMHEVLHEAAPWVKLVTETNVPHNENISYFGNGHDEAQMIYNFALPPLVLHTLQTGDASSLSNWAATLETPSDDVTFFNFTASHDGIGVRGATGILTDQQIKDMCDRVVEAGGKLNMRSLPDGSHVVYEMNVVYFNAVVGPDIDARDAIDKFMCSQAIALSLAGVPGIYLHSLLGSTNWYEGVEQTKQNRTINREKLQAKEIERELADPGSRRAQVYTRYARMLRARSALPAFHPMAAQHIANYGTGIFAIERTSRDGKQKILALHNVTNKTQSVELQGNFTDVLTGDTCVGSVKLAPYQVSWLQA